VRFVNRLFRLAARSAFGYGNFVLPAYQRNRAFLFGNDFAGTAQFGGKVPQFRKPVAHGKHRLGVVDMKLRPKREIRDGRREYVNQSPCRKSRHHVSATASAELAMVRLGLVVGADLTGPLCHLHVLRFPEREGIDGRRGPRPARLAVAIPHRLRLPGYLYFDGAAKACAGIVCAHENSPPSWRLPDQAGHAAPAPGESRDHMDQGLRAALFI